MTAATGHAGPLGRIGPNAITRVAEVLRAGPGEATAVSVFERAGLLHHLAQPPAQMVDEREVTRLHATLRDAVGLPTARELSRQAGTRTGDYLLAHRIPKPAQALLKRLPATLAARLLLPAIARHAWTFAGSGRFLVQHGRPLRLSITGNPMCRGARLNAPCCDFYAATFERLFRELVHAQARVVETQCEARGDPQCLFEVHWRHPQP